MLQLWRKAQYLKLYAMIVKNPNRTDLIFKAIDFAMADPDRKTIDAVAGVIMSHPGFVTLYESRYMPEPPALEALAEMPDGSFGRALHAHLTANGISLEIWPRGGDAGLIDYVNKRLYQEHDLWHALLGYGTSVEEELAIQAFGCAQYGSPLGAALISGGLLHLLGGQDPLQAVPAIECVSQGYALGANAEFLLGVRLHDWLEEPLEDVRARCGIPAAALAARVPAVVRRAGSGAPAASGSSGFVYARAANASTPQ